MDCVLFPLSWDYCSHIGKCPYFEEIVEVFVGEKSGLCKILSDGLETKDMYKQIKQM